MGQNHILVEYCLFTSVCPLLSAGCLVVSGEHEGVSEGLSFDRYILIFECSFNHSIFFFPLSSGSVLQCNDALSAWRQRDSHLLSQGCLTLPLARCFSKVILKRFPVVSLFQFARQSSGRPRESTPLTDGPSLDQAFLCPTGRRF